jgi:hypothetical protein
MKELSDYIESIFDGFLPRSVVNVKFDKGSYIIKVDLYDVTNLSKPEKEKTLRSITEEVIEDLLKTYFRDVPKHINIIKFYEKSYQLY